MDALACPGSSYPGCAGWLQLHPVHEALTIEVRLTSWSRQLPEGMDRKHSYPSGSCACQRARNDSPGELIAMTWRKPSHFLASSMPFLNALG